MKSGTTRPATRRSDLIQRLRYLLQLQWADIRAVGIAEGDEEQLAAEL